jgi:MFS family permease
LSGSAFQLGLTGLAQGIPLFGFGLFAGTLADFIDRRKLLLLTTAGNLLIAVTLGVLTLTGMIRVWHILVGTALTSAVNIILNPTRMAMISRLVPRSHLTNAVSLNSSVSQSAFFFGPMLGGLSIAWLTTGHAYLFNALFYLPAAAGILLIKTSGAPDGRRGTFSMASILGGVRTAGFCRHRRWLLSPSASDIRQGHSSRRPGGLRYTLFSSGHWRNRWNGSLTGHR